MSRQSREVNVMLLLIVGLSAWVVPGGGYFLLREKKRAAIIFVTIILTFCTGLYVGSIGVVDPVGAKLWYVTQIMSSPAVAGLGYLAAGGHYPVYGKPSEIGQIYTSIAGLLNLLCAINSVYLSYLRSTETEKS